MNAEPLGSNTSEDAEEFSKIMRAIRVSDTHMLGSTLQAFPHLAGQTQDKKWSPLFEAALRCDLATDTSKSKPAFQCLQLVLASRVDVKTLLNGVSPLHTAISNPEAVALLLDSGANIEARNTKAATPLIFAAECSAWKTFNLLLTRGADIHAVDDLGKTAFMQTSKLVPEDTWMSIVAPLLKSYKVNKSDIRGNTLLMYAARNQSVRVCQALLEAGADVLRVNLSNETALDIARRRGAGELVSVLSAYLSQAQVAHGILGASLAPPIELPAVTPRRRPTCI